MWGSSDIFYDCYYSNSKCRKFLFSNEQLKIFYVRQTCVQTNKLRGVSGGDRFVENAKLDSVITGALFLNRLKGVRYS